MRAISTYALAHRSLAHMANRFPHGLVAKAHETITARWPVIVAGLIFLTHALYFGPWIIDDAGVSYVYARNLISGHGLVQQPGMPPVEGYSNFLWVLLLAPFMLLRAFDPIATPKLISVVLVLGAFVLVHDSLKRLCGSAATLLTLVTLGCCAVNTGFVVWTTSGLENPLYLLLLCGLFRTSVRLVEPADTARRDAPLAALLAAGVAMTRPDGLIFVPLYPALFFATRHQTVRSSDSAEPGRGLVFASYTATFVLVFGAFLLFRLQYFGDLLPNTYYAKADGSIVRNVLAALTLQPRIIAKGLDLMASVGGRAGTLLLVGLLWATYAYARRWRLRLELVIPLTFLVFSSAAYMLMPNDWMGEYRFATSFYLFFYAYAAMLGYSAIRSALPPARQSFAIGCAIVVIGLGSTLIFPPRSVRFASNPPTPFSAVAARYGLFFNRHAARLGLRNASILTPDAGGTLYYTTLRFYDMGGLCDRVIARTLGKDQEAFYEYVFETIKPTFIAVPHPWFAQLAAFDQDRRFRRDYVPLYEYQTAINGSIARAGYFVRKDAVENQADVFDGMRSEFARQADVLTVVWQDDAR